MRVAKRKVQQLKVIDYGPKYKGKDKPKIQYKPYQYQLHALKHVLRNRYSALWLEMGLGKTVITLTAIHDLIFKYYEVQRVLIIAPLRVASKVWPDELEKWPHLRGLTYSKVIGTQRQRLRALAVNAHIYIINRENVAWLVATMRNWVFDCCIVDESSSFKNQNSERFKALMKVRPLMYRMIQLSGTPAPNSLLDLWPQMKLLDLGKRLGTTVTYYRDTFFGIDKVIKDHVHTYKVLPHGEKAIHRKVSDICISMKTRDYLELPDRIDRVIDIEFSKKVMAQYYEFEKEKVLELLNSEDDITAKTAAALSNKLRQFVSGFVYDEDKKAHNVHSYKLDALEEYVDVMNGRPLLVFYWFKHTKIQLLKKFKKYKPLLLQSDKDIDTWNRGKTSLMFLHPASGGHGLNLQYGGSQQIWFDNIWSLELVLQANGRIDRPGQVNNVISHALKANGTIDEAILDSNANKNKGQSALMAFTKARIKQYSK